MKKVVLWGVIVAAGIIGMVAVAGIIRFNIMGGGDVLPSGATGLSDLSVTIDAPLVVVNDSGGSGRAYHALAAIAQDDSYRATNALPLGDRMTPQVIEYRDGRFVYHYLGRSLDQPMSEPPTVEDTLTVRLDRANGVITAEP